MNVSIGLRKVSRHQLPKSLLLFVVLTWPMRAHCVPLPERNKHRDSVENLGTTLNDTYQHRVRPGQISRLALMMPSEKLVPVLI